ncbi:MAG: hypothetical protein IKO46_08345 [Salinivirgaceae bacterium]|nr:hypothetical protein [Salinivirgaceae bacterium]
MEDQKQPIESEEREIDLIDLMGRFFSWLGKAFKSALLNISYFLIRNFYFYIAAIVLVVLLTILQSRFADKYYYCEMVVQSKAINATEAVNLVNNWNYKIQLPDTLIGGIKSINGTFVLDYNRDGLGDDFEVYDGKFSRDTVMVNNRLSDEFCVQAQIFNADNRITLDEIKKELFEYLESDSWVINCNKIRQEENRAMIARIDKEIAVLDSLKETEYFNASERYKMDKNGALMMVSEKDKHLYHNDIIKLLAQKQEVERNFYPEPFKIKQDFSTPMESVNNMFNNFKQNCIIVLIIVTLAALLFDQRKSIRRLIQKSKRKDD